jgi:hypothetical protein
MTVSTSIGLAAAAPLDRKPRRCDARPSAAKERWRTEKGDFVKMVLAYFEKI